MDMISESTRLEQAHLAQSAAGASLGSSKGTDTNRTSTTLSVIVPVYNEQYLIESSLSRLRVLAESPLLREIKIIVVDDGSTDGTSRAIERFRKMLESEEDDGKTSWSWWRHERNSGKGAAIR